MEILLAVVTKLEHCMLRNKLAMYRLIESNRIELSLSSWIAQLYRLHGSASESNRKTRANYYSVLSSLRCRNVSILRSYVMLVHLQWINRSKFIFQAITKNYNVVNATVLEGYQKSITLIKTGRNVIMNWQNNKPVYVHPLFSQTHFNDKSAWSFAVAYNALY